MDWKKIIKILAVIIIIAAFIAGLYYFFRTNPTIQNIQKAVVSVFPGPQKSGEQTSQPSLAAKLQNISEDQIFDYWINKKTGDVYYANKAGQIIKSANGKEELVNSQTINNLNRLESSYDGSSAVAKFNYPSLPTFSIFNAETNGWRALPQDTISATWSPNSGEVIYLDDKALKILNLADQKTRELSKMNQKDIELHWRNDSKILLTSNLNSAVKIWAWDLNKKTLVPFLMEVGTAISWSKDDKFGIKLNSANETPRTSLIDGNGNVLSEFTFKTLPSKCLIQDQKIYCAIPKNIPGNVKLPEDYYKKAVYFEDVFYIINLSTGGFSEIPTENPDLAIDAEHLEVFGGKLFFKNRLDDKLYNIQL